MLGPRRVISVLLQLGEWVFPRIERSTRDLPDGRVELTLRLPPDYEDCEAFFRVTQACLGGAPIYSGHGPAEVEATYSARAGTFLIPVPNAASAMTPRPTPGFREYALQTIAHLQAEVSALWRERRRGTADASTRSLREVAREWGLTPRQTEVLEEVAAGRSNREIASRLACSERTVEVHVSSLLSKGGMRSRSQLIASLYAPPAERRLR
jgi:DNA-binding CsgD family transcriptional regulator